MTNFDLIVKNVDIFSEFIKNCMDGNCENCPVGMDRCSEWNSETDDGLECEVIIKRWLTMDNERN